MRSKKPLCESDPPPGPRTPRRWTLLWVALIVLVTLLPVLAVGVTVRASGTHSLEALIPPEDYLVLPPEATAELRPDPEPAAAVAEPAPPDPSAWIQSIESALSAAPAIDNVTLVDLKDLTMFMLCAWALLQFRNQH